MLSKCRLGDHVCTAKNCARGSVSLRAKSSCIMEECAWYFKATDDIWSNCVHGDSKCPAEVPGVHAVQMQSCGACGHADELGSGALKAEDQKQLHHIRMRPVRRGNGRHLVKLGCRRFSGSPQSPQDPCCAIAVSGLMFCAAKN